MRTARYALLLVLMVVVRIEAESDSENHRAAKRATPAAIIHTYEEYSRIPTGGKYWYNNRLQTKTTPAEPSVAPKAELVATPVQSTAVATPMPVETLTPTYPVITTQEEYDRLPAGTFFLWRDKLLKKQTPTPPLAPITTSVGPIRIPAPGLAPTVVITLLLVAAVIVFLLWKIVFVKLKPKVYPKRELVERHPQIYSDYEHHQLALKRWESDRQLFEKVESDRLTELGAWASKGGPLTGLAFLAGTVVTIFAANRAGSGAGWGTGIGSLIASGAVMSAEEHFRRWRHQALFVRHEFNQPAPVYVPPAQPPPRNEPPPRREPPPRQEPPPEGKRVDPSTEVTAMRQAYEILGIAPGRISMKDVKKTYRNLMTQYHPDRAAHLGKEFQEIAAKKALALNLAMEFIEKNCKS